MNRKEEIEKMLIEWFSMMLVKYTWLKIKYEYNEAKERYLVSFYMSKSVDGSDFDKDVLMFENSMDDKFGDYSPLFCDNESLFKLSPNSAMIDSIFTNENYEGVAQFDLNISAFQEEAKSTTDKFCYTDYKYDIAV